MTAAPYYRKEKIMPTELIYGSESTVDAADVGREISSARKRRRPVRRLGFLGTRFRGGAPRAFRTLGRKLTGKASAARGETDRAHLNLQELEVCGVPGVGNGAIESLAPFLNSSGTLRSLDLTGASFDADAIRRVEPFLAKNKSLETLVLGDNVAVGDKGVDIVTSALEAGKPGRVRVLALESCGLGPASVTSITNFMIGGGGESLRQLELSGNNIGDSGAKVIAVAIGAGHQLIRLGLNDAGVGDMGVTAFASVLKNNQSLSTLTLQKNSGITNMGASVLLDVIFDYTSIKTIVGSNHTLRDVNLKGCKNISDGSLLQTFVKLSARGRLLETVHEVIRLKITSWIENSTKDGVLAAAPQLEDLDLGLMPHLLRFVGESCKSSGVTCLFLALKSMPLLYAHHGASSTMVPEAEAHQADTEEDEEEMEAIEEEEIEEDETMAPEEDKKRPRGAMKYCALFKSLAPKCRFIVRSTCSHSSGSEEAAGVRYHHVSPEDTFQGICLRYNITPTELRQANRMSGSNLKLAPDKLIIPNSNVNDQPANHAVSKDCKITSLISNAARFTRNRLSCTEARAYLEISDWDLDCAIEDVREDLGFFA